MYSLTCVCTRTRHGSLLSSLFSLLSPSLPPPLPLPLCPAPLSLLSSCPSPPLSLSPPLSQVHRDLPRAEPRGRSPALTLRLRLHRAQSERRQRQGDAPQYELKAHLNTNMHSMYCSSVGVNWLACTRLTIKLTVAWLADWVGGWLTGHALRLGRAVRPPFLPQHHVQVRAKYQY